jgi:D-tyrosyl-tRNA(Tyr) deacylase
MIGLLQRVSSARVTVAGGEIASIGRGLLVLVGVAAGDDKARADRLLERLLGYRVFPDAAGKMNLDLRAVAGGLLLVPQFTLAADTRSGTRAGFSTAAAPAPGRELFEYLVTQAHARHGNVAWGRFGAQMSVALVNEGPVTFWLES